MQKWTKLPHSFLPSTLLRSMERGSGMNVQKVILYIPMLVCVFILKEKVNDFCKDL